MTQAQAIQLVQSLPRKVIALLWALSTVKSTGADGATYRGLEAMLGTRKRATLRDTVLIAEVARLVDVYAVAGKRSAIVLSDFGILLVKKVLNVKPREDDKE